MRSPDPSRRRFLTLTASAASLTALGLPAGAAAASPAASPAARPGREPDFGPNVFVYDPSTPVEEIQSTLDRLFTAQERNEMGFDRYAVLFKPGRYEVDARLGYYTTVAGLGAHPDDVEIHGAVRVVGQPDPNSPAGISALTNFWRSAENLAVTPTDWSNQWAVSQASPMRRVHVKGVLWLEPGNGGYSSGGYIADSKVDGITINGSQQQWLTRDSELGGEWTNGVWNQVFSGVIGAPAQGFPDPPYTTLPTSPVTREKPYLFVDARGAWRVAVPRLRRDTAGTTWATGGAPVPSLPLSAFYLARPTDSAKRINAELARGGTCCSPPASTTWTGPCGYAARTPSCSASACPAWCRTAGTRRCGSRTWTGSASPGCSWTPGRSSRRCWSRSARGTATVRTPRTRSRCRTSSSASAARTPGGR